VWQENSVATEDFILSHSAVYLQNPKVKELLKSIHICESYRKNKSGTFFIAHGVEYTKHGHKISVSFKQ